MQKDERLQTRGIPQRIRRAAMHARAMAPPIFCKCLGACTFIGRTTTRCEWIRIPESRPACFISVFRLRRMRRRPGKDTRPRHGAETTPETGVMARVDLCRIKRGIL